MNYKKKFENAILFAENRKSSKETFGAFEYGDIVEYTLKCDRSYAICNPKILFTNAHTENKFELMLNFSNLSKSEEYFKGVLNTKELCSENGLFFCKLIYFLKDKEIKEAFQLIIYEKGFNTPNWIKGGVVYQIFPDRFYHFGEFPVREGSVIRKDWNNPHIQHSDEKGGFVLNNEFFCGNLKGIEAKLDYIASLGVNAIYLCPVFESTSNHRYDTSDYLKIDALLGTNDDFVQLCKIAKSKGIRIILDGVFNHTGDDSIYFDRRNKYQNGAFNNENSPYRSWYNFNYGEYGYECWWNIPILPRVNSDVKSYRDFVLGENGVVPYWLRKGGTGWRLDVADELSDGFIEKLRDSAKKEAPDCIIIGEVWEDASNKISYGQLKKYLLGKELDSVMNYPFRAGIIDCLKNRSPKILCKTVENICETYPRCVRDVLLNFLGTHDTARILNVLTPEYPNFMTNNELESAYLSDTEKEKSEVLMKIGFTLLFTLPGIPCIFYGDEIPMEGWDDPFNRKPFPWGRENSKMTEYIRILGKIRKESDAFYDGEYNTLLCNGNVYSFCRQGEKDSVSVVVNMGKDMLILNKPYFSLIQNKKVSAVSPISCDILSGKAYFYNI